MQPFPPLEDFDAMAVYADMLSVRGDPRGELTHLQLALENRPGDPRLVRAIEQHVARHDRQLLGSLRTSTALCTFRWQRGFIVEAQLKSSAGRREWSRGGWVETTPKSKLPRVVRELLRLESAAPMSMLSITLPRSWSARELLLQCVDEVARATHRLDVLGVYFELNERLYPELGDTIEERCGSLHVSADASIAGSVFERFG
ncbi:MAG: hypothetical protein QM817_41005 [Archangium sp.]